MFKANSNILGYSFGFGSSEWSIAIDMECSKHSPHNVQLSLSSCDEDSFNCADGSCIPIYQRCDQVCQCKDNSDEMNCDRLFINSTYQKQQSPEPEGNTAINFTVEIVDILDIDEMASVMRILYKRRLCWADLRIKWRNIKMDDDDMMKEGIRISDKESDMIWKPIVLENDIDLLNRNIHMKTKGIEI